MKFYTKQEDGEYAEATEQDLSKVIGPRLKRYEETELKKLRSELEESTSKELTEKLTSELTEKLKAEYQPKLDEVENKLKLADIHLRQKTIAAEYGFKSELENFLGDGSEEEMRARADILKDNSAKVVTTPAKETKTPIVTGFVSKV